MFPCLCQTEPFGTSSEVFGHLPLLSDRYEKSWHSQDTGEKCHFFKLKIKLAGIQWPPPFNPSFYKGGHQMLAEPEIEVGRRLWGAGAGEERLD